MTTKRNAPQHSITFYPELKQLVVRAEAVMNKPKSRLLYDACVRGLRDSLREIEQNIALIEYECSPYDAEYLQSLAAKARLSQSEFLRRLIEEYGETLVEVSTQTQP